MNANEMDQVFAEAGESREITARDALGMIAKSMSKVADPETGDDEARDVMVRVYAFTKAARGLLDADTDGETVAIEKALVDAVEADGSDARVEPVSRAVDAIRKRFGEPEPTPADPTPSEGEGEGEGDAGASEGDGGDVRWQHDLNAEPDPEDDWGNDPSF